MNMPVYSMSNEDILIPPAVVDLAVRLADEGVPVRAIARCMKQPCEDIYEVLRAAKTAGSIVEIPKDDWAPGSTRTARAQFVNTPFANDEAVQFACARRFHTTRLESAVLSLMIKRAEVTKQQIHIVIEANRRGHDKDETDIKMVDVIICHIRRKLRPFNLAIETVWALGYRFDAKNREAIQTMVAGFITGAHHG